MKKFLKKRGGKKFHKKGKKGGRGQHLNTYHMQRGGGRL